MLKISITFQFSPPVSVVHFKGEVLQYISTLCMLLEAFTVSVIAPTASMVICGILFGGIHPTKVCINAEFTNANMNCVLFCEISF